MGLQLKLTMLSPRHRMQEAKSLWPNLHLPWAHASLGPPHTANTLLENSSLLGPALEVRGNGGNAGTPS
eukprot:CAMPEP_0181288474 /NCGR_PEP_ID=MMETSP1101-20121128/350_1 /TAXON_ID=46948 /ORGANISM="Rhodomonas abbreviata, Strain Caron Lab Isolate" /LENGTH=68 /DNA_ID=CAMNT_0023392595 /DNA_START=320 /DNA_END=523 /DNA_ORIENTATION=-